MQKRMGRPKVKKGKQKIPFPIRFERDSIAAFKRAAKRARIPVALWVAQALTNAAKIT